MSGTDETQALEAQEQKPRGMEAATAAIALGSHGLAPSNFDEQWRVAAAAKSSGLLPVKTTAEAWLIMQRGSELGFPLITAVEFLYPVKGRLRLTPDGAKALALRSGLLEDFKEFEEGVVKETEKGLEFADDFRAVCWIKRRDVREPIVRTFSVADAKQAGLWMKRGATGGDSAWVSFPRRMLAARARGFAFQDGFRDVTGGLQVRDRHDLAMGESIGGVVVAPPGARDITPSSAPPAHRHPVLAQLIKQPPVVEVVAQAATEEPAGPAPVERPFDLAEARAALFAEAKRRTDDDSAASDLVKEVTGGITTVKTQADAQAAAAKMAAHPRFGDEA